MEAVYRKIGLNSRAEAVNLARVHGLPWEGVHFSQVCAPCSSEMAAVSIASPD
jgi:hypothetical protein